MLLEDRFDKTCKDMEKIFSAVCVPIIEQQTVLSPGQKRRKSTSNILPLKSLPEGNVLGVLKCVNKIDFVQQMAGIPFSDDDVGLTCLFAESILDTIQAFPSNMQLAAAMPPSVSFSQTGSAEGAKEQ